MTDDGNPFDVWQKLKKLGIRTYVFRARHITDLPRAIRDLGKALGISCRASRKTAKMETAFRGYEAKRKNSLPGPPMKRAIFIVHQEPLVVAGPGTVFDDALKMIGLQNIAADSGSSYPKYSLGEILRRSPDIIFVGQGSMTGNQANNLLKKLNGLDAVRKGHVYYTSELLYRMGPRIITGIREMERCFQTY